MSAPLWRAVEASWHLDETRIETLQVYADWLLSQGDPHGELIALGCALRAARAEPARYRRLYTEYDRRLQELEPRLIGHRLADVDGLEYRTLCGFLDSVQLDATVCAPAHLVELLERPAARLVRQVALGCSSIPDTEPAEPVLRYLENLWPRPHLRTLTLSDITLNDSALAGLSRFQALDSLTLRECHLQPDTETSAGASWLSYLPQLRELDLRSDDLPLSTTAAFGQLPNLRHCTLRPPVAHPTECFDHVLQLPALGELNIAFIQSMPDQLCRGSSDLGALRAHDRLEVAIEKQSPEPECWSRLASIPSLRELALLLVELDESAMHALAPATQLESLRMNCCEAEHSDLLEILPTFPHLKTLDLSENEWMHGNALSYLARTPTLEELSVSECLRFGRRHAELIASLPELRFLELIDCQILQSGALEPLADMTEMRNLDIGLMDDIEPSDLYFVTELPHLEELNLWDVPFDQELIERIAACTRLQVLGLNSETLHDDWLPALTRLSELTFLSLEQDQLSGATEARLRSGLPDCRIVIWGR